MNETIIRKMANVKFSFFYVPLVLLGLIACFLYYHEAFGKSEYTEFQRNLFLYGNGELSKFPRVMDNLTQLGDGLVFLSFFAILVIFAPKCWESFITALVISCIFTSTLKSLFAVPRPAATYLKDNFAIIGPKLTGHNSFPSGHSVTTFTILTVILFAFMPRDLTKRIIWCCFICGIGIVIISTRVGVGAHYPIDTLCGAIIGYISAVLGILVARRFKIWNWMSNIKFYPIFIALFIVSSVVLIIKILATNLFIFYLALLSLLIAIFVITKVYVKKQL